MESKPRFSIVTVSYNCKDDLEKTLDSVCNQTYRNYEYIIIDGNSNDGTKELLKSREKDITYWVSQKDEGIYNAMNKGARVAKGDYIYFLNAGDTFVDENTLDKVNRDISNNQDLIYGRVRVVNKRNNNSYIKGKTLTKFNLKFGNKVSQQAVFIKREVFNKVGGLDERYKIAADFDLLCKVFEGNFLIKRIDLIICNYDGDGVSSNLKISYGDTMLAIKNREGVAFASIYKVVTDIKRLIFYLSEFFTKSGILSTDGRRKTTVNTFWGFIEKIILNILNLYVFTLVVRFLGAEDFGRYSYFLGIYNMFFLVSSFGLSSAFIDKLIKEPEKRDRIINAAFLIRLITAILAIIGSTTFVYFSTKDISQVFIISILNISYIFSIFDVLGDTLVSDLKSKYSSFVRTISYLLSAALKIYLIYIKANWSLFLIACSFEIVIQFVGYWIVFIKSNKTFKFGKADFFIIKELFFNSIPLFLGVVSAFISSKYYLFIIEKFNTMSDVGYYSTANKFSEIWMLILGVVIANIAPKISRIFREDKKKYLFLRGNIYTLLSMISIVYSIFIFVFSSLIIDILLGKEFLLVTILMRISIWGSLFTAFIISLNRFMILEGLKKEYALISLIQIFSSLLVGYILISNIGLLGTAIAVVISGFLNIIVIPMLFKRTRPHVILMLKSFSFGRIKDLYKWLIK